MSTTATADSTTIPRARRDVVRLPYVQSLSKLARPLA